MDLACLVFGILFIVAGVLFAFGRLHTRLRAWKVMSPEDRKAIRILPLCRNIGGMIALCGGIFLLGGIYRAFRERGFTVAIILWLIMAGIDVWQIGRSGRYTR